MRIYNTFAMAGLGLLANASFADTTQEPIKIASVTMDTIVVTASRIEKPIKDVAGNIAVMTSDDLDRQIITDMSQLFRYDPSIHVTGDIGGAQNISIRGMGGDRVLMIKDGMRMSEGYGANGLNDIVGRGFIDPGILKQVSASKTASSLYGSDGLAGVVVFTTKDASDYLKDNDTIGGDIRAFYDSGAKQKTLASTFALRTGIVEQIFNINVREGEQEQNYHKSKDPFDVRTQSFFYKNKINITDTDFLSVNFDLFKQTSNGNRADSLLSMFRGLSSMGYKIATENSKSTRDNQSVKLSYESSNSNVVYDHLSISLYSNNSKQDDVQYGFLDINSPMMGLVQKRHMWETGVFEQKTLGLLSKIRKTLNDEHTFVYGLDVEQTQSLRTVHELRVVVGNPSSPSNKDVTTNKFPKTDVTRYGIYFTDDISLVDGQLELMPGIRYDRFDMDPNGAVDSTGKAFKKISDDNIALNFGALWHFTQEFSGFFQFAQGFKVPAYDLAYIEHDLQPTSTYRYTIQPSDNLSPEKSNTFELGVKGQWSAVSFTASIFYNQFDDFLETALVSSTTTGGVTHDIFQYQNIDAVTIQGAELGVSYNASNMITLFANAAFQHGKNDKTGEYISSINPLSGVVGINFHANNWESEVIASWADDMRFVNSGTMTSKGYVKYDWLFNYQIKHNIKINLAVYNITDKKYAKFGSVANRAVGSNISNALEAGRSFSAGLSYQF